MILGGCSSATKSFLREHSPPSQPSPLPPAKTKQNNTLALESESYISPLFYREVCREFENEELNFSDDAKYHDRFVPVYFRKPSPHRRIQTYILHIH